jgi:hypothetical protein
MPIRQEGTKFTFGEGFAVHKEKFLPITPEEESIGNAIVNAAYIVH